MFRRYIITILFLLISVSLVFARTHTVASGETLTSIARIYNTSIDELKRINNLSSDMIREGQRLTIPNNYQQGDLYVVKWGETLSGLSSKFNVTIQAIKNANNLTSEMIREGQRLAIPGHYPPPVSHQTTYTPPTSTINIPAEEKQTRPVLYLFSAYLPPPAAVEIEDFEEEIADVSTVVYTSDKSEQVNNILDAALSYIGIPYVYGGIDRSGFDCSGLVFRVFKDHGIDLQRTVTGMESDGIEVTYENLQPGDLIIFYNPKHVGIYIGNGRFIHSSSYRNRGVVISSLDRESYSSRYHSARRVIY